MESVRKMIKKVADDIRGLETSDTDPRVKAIILTKLEEAELWATRFDK